MIALLQIHSYCTLGECVISMDWFWNRKLNCLKALWGCYERAHIRKKSEGNTPGIFFRYINVQGLYNCSHMWLPDEFTMDTKYELSNPASRLHFHSGHYWYYRKQEKKNSKPLTYFSNSVVNRRWTQIAQGFFIFHWLI